MPYVLFESTNNWAQVGLTQIEIGQTLSREFMVKIDLSFEIDSKYPVDVFATLPVWLTFNLSENLEEKGKRKKEKELVFFSRKLGVFS